MKAIMSAFKINFHEFSLKKPLKSVAKEESSNFYKTSEQSGIQSVFFSSSCFIKVNFIFILQSISPGLVEQDIIVSCTENELVQLMPKLKPEDVANAVQYVITLPEHVQVHELVR